MFGLFKNYSLFTKACLALIPACFIAMIVAATYESWFFVATFAVLYVGFVVLFVLFGSQDAKKLKEKSDSESVE